MGTPDLRAVTNQVPPLEGHNVVTSDAALSEAVLRHGSAEVLDDLLPLGAEAGTAEAREHGVLANRHHPELAPYDRYGNRVDEVRYGGRTATAADDTLMRRLDEDARHARPGPAESGVALAVPR